jgi:hypothetical protein
MIIIYLYQYELQSSNIALMHYTNMCVFIKIISTMRQESYVFGRSPTRRILVSKVGAFLGNKEIYEVETFNGSSLADSIC